MGRRVLRVSPEMFVEFFKNKDGRIRTYEVVDGLPDDARVIEERWLTRAPRTTVEQATLAIVLESDEWAGNSDYVEPTPTVRIHVGAVAESAEMTAIARKAFKEAILKDWEAQHGPAH